MTGWPLARSIFVQKLVHFLVRPTEMMTKLMNDHMLDQFFQRHIRARLDLSQQGLAVEKDARAVRAWKGDAVMDERDALIKAGQFPAVMYAKIR